MYYSATALPLMSSLELVEEPMLPVVDLSVDRSEVASEDTPELLLATSAVVPTILPVIARPRL